MSKRKGTDVPAEDSRIGEQSPSEARAEARSSAVYDTPEQTVPLVGSAIIVPSGGLGFYAADGRPLLTLTENDLGPCLSLFNGLGAPVAILQAQATGAALLLRTPNGSHTAQANVSAAVGGFFSVTEGKQTQVARMETEEVVLSPELFPAGQTIH